MSPSAVSASITLFFFIVSEVVINCKGSSDSVWEEKGSQPRVISVGNKMRGYCT